MIQLHTVKGLVHVTIVTQGEEWVIRGGCYGSDASEVKYRRGAPRAWLKQIRNNPRVSGGIPYPGWVPCCMQPDSSLLSR